MVRKMRVHVAKQFWLICFFNLFILVNATPLFAYQSSCATYPCHPVLSGGAGYISSSKLGESQTFPITNVVTDSYYIYTPNNATRTVGVFDVFLGMEFGPTATSTAAMQLGFGYSQSAPFTAKGTYGITQGADTPSQDTFTYQYDITLRQLLFEGKLLFALHEIYHPYLFGGIGVAFNTANDFKVHDMPPTFTRVYANNTSNQLSYSIGAGLDYDLDQYLRVGVGYRFSDYGKVSLGSAMIDNVPVGGTLSQAHFYTHEILGQVTLALM